MENNNQKIIFNVPNEKSTMEIISVILERSGLKEDKKQIHEKIINGQHSLAASIKKMVIDFAAKKITEKELLSSISKELSISGDISQKIIEDIKSEIIPYTQTILIKDEEAQEEKIQNVPKKPGRPIATKETKIEEGNNPSASQKGPDRYRESIE